MADIDNPRGQSLAEILEIPELVPLHSGENDYERISREEEAIERNATLKQIDAALQRSHEIAEKERQAGVRAMYKAVYGTNEATKKNEGNE